MSHGPPYSVEFENDGTATTTETTAANALWHAQGVRSNRFTLTNDDASINLLWRVDTDTDQKVLGAGETFSVNARTKRVFLESASSTVAYRLWGWG